MDNLVKKLYFKSIFLRNYIYVSYIVLFQIYCIFMFFGYIVYVYIFQKKMVKNTQIEPES